MHLVVTEHLGRLARCIERLIGVVRHQRMFLVGAHPHAGRLEIVGVGYRVQAKGQDLEFSVGFSHVVRVTPPDGISFTVENPTKFSVSGIDKQQVGQVAANIRQIRKPEPYKGKGIRYAGEQVRRKVGKAGK